MSYIQNNLIPNEKILFHTKKSLIIFIAPIFFSLLALFFFLNPNPFVQKASILVVFAAGLYWINQLLMYYFSEFAVTNVRVMMREGFFIRHTNDTRLSALANVTVNQSLIGQWLNYGTVFINSFGGASDPFRDIDKPLQFQKTLQEQLYSIQKNPLT
ncbi:MAG TPA: PH domain-containing protein [Gammaproteobacteria bacterium]|jgi:uncharacterized membrane protein YdbT with pleckstrin-like domain|nr:PH domain-containing protein [Gammaproteobacteria bacterium]